MPDFAISRPASGDRDEILSFGELANLTNERRRRDPGRLRPQNPAAQSSRLKDRSVRRRLHVRDRLTAWRAGAPDPSVDVISIHGFGLGQRGEVRARGSIQDTDAGRRSLPYGKVSGLPTLPCFIGDADPLLVKVPGTNCTCTERSASHTGGDTQDEARALFTEFVSRRLAAYAPLLSGRPIARMTPCRSPVVEFKLRILLHEPRSPDRRLKAFLNRTADVLPLSRWRRVG